MGAKELIKETFEEWSRDDSLQLGASLAYYSIFSLAPLVFILIAAAGFFFEGDAGRQVREQLGAFMGEDAARTLNATLDRRQLGDGGGTAALLSLGVLVFTATGVFAALQSALNKIWNVAPRPGGGITGLVRTRLLSLVMVLTALLVLLASMLVSAVVSFVGSSSATMLPGGSLVSAILENPVVARIIESSISFAVLVVLFGAIFKYLPDVEIGWREVWLGAVVTAGLFSIGKAALGYYLAHSSPGSAYGAAGSLIVVLVWIYYSSQILFLGAEFTQVWARHHGRRIEPSPHAFRLKPPEPPSEAETPNGEPDTGAGPAPASASSWGVALAAGLVGLTVGRALARQTSALERPADDRGPEGQRRAA